MIFKLVKEFVMKHWLKLIGASTLIVLIFMLWSIITAKETNQLPTNMEISWYETQIEGYIKLQGHAHQMAESARGLGYPDSHSIIQTAKNEWATAQNNIDEMTAIVEKLKAEEEARLNAKREEYPTAMYVWEYLTSRGYNEYVVAGIMGNLMAETGGQTLNLQVDATSPGYYGICQWSLYYSPQIENTDLDYQLDYLCSTMEYEFNTFGGQYKKGFNYETFTYMLDEEEAALAFAKCYERCASSSYNVRKKNAKKAYEYFTS